MKKWIDPISRANLMVLARVTTREEMAKHLRATIAIVDAMHVDEEIDPSMTNATQIINTEKYMFLIKTEQVSICRDGTFGYDTHVKIDLRGKGFTIEAKDGGITMEVPESLGIHHLNLMDRGELTTRHLIELDGMPDLPIVEIMTLPGKMIYRPRKASVKSWGAAIREAETVNLQHNQEAETQPCHTTSLSDRIHTTIRRIRTDFCKD